MTDTKTILTIETIPQPIRDWLASNVSTYIVIEINNRLGFKDTKRQIIPSLVFWLVTREIAPEDFITQIGQELKINPSSAKNIAAEIVEKLLRPIEKTLRTELDVDISKILTAELPIKEIPTPVIQEKIEAIKPIVKIAPEWQLSASSIIEGEKPFIIHEETPTFKIPIKIAPPTIKPRPTPPPVSAIAPILKAAKPPEIPQKTQIQTKPETKELKMLPNVAHKKSHRIVHYSNFTSPL